VKAVVATEVEKVLAPVAKPLDIDTAHKPFVILVVGVNGSGKTTTIGKLASKFSSEGRKVMLAAGDTFRAAAIEQLKVWGERTKSPVIAGAQGSDSASLAFNALTAARDGQTSSRRSTHRRRMRCFWCSMPRWDKMRCRRSRHSIVPRESPASS
jgi:fused signal recognition particle receptor